MEELLFDYNLRSDTVVFMDVLTIDSPYISKKPRDHESLFFVTDGNLLYESGGESVVIKSGNVGYIARGAVDKSSVYNCESVSYITVNFLFDRENSVRTLPFSTLCSLNINYNYEKLFNEALNCFIQKAPGYMTVCNGIIMQIIGLLFNEHCMGTGDLKKLLKIKASVEYLKDNYASSELEIGSLARLSNMSEKNFRRIFTEIYHKTPYAFLVEFRIDKSKILLTNTRKSISEIAYQCGFSDVYSFSHSFKKHTGISPYNYRKDF